MKHTDLVTELVRIRLLVNVKFMLHYNINDREHYKIITLTDSNKEYLPLILVMWMRKLLPAKYTKLEFTRQQQSSFLPKSMPL